MPATAPKPCATPTSRFGVAPRLRSVPARGPASTTARASRARLRTCLLRARDPRLGGRAAPRQTCRARHVRPFRADSWCDGADRDMCVARRKRGPRDCALARLVLLKRTSLITGCQRDDAGPPVGRVGLGWCRRSRSQRRQGALSAGPRRQATGHEGAEAAVGGRRRLVETDALTSRAIGRVVPPPPDRLRLRPRAGRRSCSGG